MRRDLIIVLLVATSLVQLTCLILTAPSRLPAEKSEVEITLYEMPEILEIGETGVFQLRTTPGNLCIGVIGYRNAINNKWITVDLPEKEANIDGLCGWEWKAALNAETGIAEFRAAVRHGDMYGYIGPQIFCIEKCPWGEP